MKKYLFYIIFTIYSGFTFCTTITITTSGFTFTPNTINISVGDTVIFDIPNIHKPIEVSQTTWNANNNSPVTGFSTPFGGGQVVGLTAGVHFYVCQPHASLGMKGIINVEGTSGIFNHQSQKSILVYPNPSNGKFQFTINNFEFAKNTNLEIYNIQGAKVYQSEIINTKSAIDLSNQTNGVYFIKIFDGKTILTKEITIE